MKQKMLHGDRMETKDFENAIKDWEWKWVNAHEVYASLPQGNVAETVNKIFKKYALQIRED